MTERFPEIAAAADSLPDGTVLDGEIMPWKDGGAAAVRAAAARIGRQVKLGRRS